MADETPGWVSNADLASRLSALVDRWNQRENQMIAFINQETGTVQVTDALGVVHELKSFPALEAEVTALLDPLEGAVSQAQDINSQTIHYAGLAHDSADAAAVDADEAASSASSAASAAGTAATKAGEAVVSAATASTKAEEATASAATATTQAGNATTEASTAALRAGDANTDAVAANESAQAAAQSAAQAAQSAAGKLAWFGVWNIESGTLPAAPPGDGFYLVSGSATVNGQAYGSGDMLVWGEESEWHRIDNQQSVASVAGLVGTITVGQLQQALNLSAVGTSGQYDDLLGRPTLGTAAEQDVSAFASQAQGGTADAALPRTGGTLSGATAVDTGGAIGVNWNFTVTVPGGKGQGSGIAFGATFCKNWGGTDGGTRTSGGIAYLPSETSGGARDHRIALFTNTASSDARTEQASVNNAGVFTARTAIFAPNVTDSSDARLKTNIRRDPNRYRGIRRAIEMVLYDRLSGTSDNEPGVLAQEVQRAGCHADDFVGEQSDGTLTVHYGKLALACALDPEPWT